jgi:Cytochrome c554 and c-prime
MKLWKLTLLLLAVSSIALTGCSDDDDPITPADPPELAYAGSDACGACHVDNHAMWTHSGHPYKLTKLDGAAPTSFPDPSAFFDDATDPLPAGKTWADFSYTIGGFGWKMRWIQNDGYIYTPAGGENQYNFENQSWSDYHAGEEKKYNCGACHTTGWEGSDDGNSDNNQDGMEGFVGTFFEGGIGCENCHGMGSQHIFDQEQFPLTLDDSSAFCGKCHTRGGDNGVTPGETVIEASFNTDTGVGFIKHHEQYDEWYNSPHNSNFGPGCNDCHNPHASVVYDASTPGEGVSSTVTCESCHVDGAHATISPINHHGATCVDCHMPDASKSAIANNDHTGDVSTHLWTINTSVNGKADMFSADGTSVVIDEGIASITLDFACYGCHKDANNEGGDNSFKSLEDLAARAPTIHTYVGKAVASK